MDNKDRFKALLRELNKGIYEKETEIGMSLLAALAGESVILLGPPGVAKSLIARRIKCAFRDAQTFEYLMSRFSTPDEIFGPVSIARLKENDKYERATDGFLPTADIAFLDEIWKAGPAILNTLLTIINEKIFRNGDRVAPVPLKLLVGASNELPASGEGLEALWDRFLVRIVSGCVTNEENFYNILREESTDSDMTILDIPKPLQITSKEYLTIQKGIRAIGIDDCVFECITYIRRNIAKMRIVDEGTEGASRLHNIYVSDRRWKHMMHLLRASAYMHGRDKVSVADLLPLEHCIWNEPDELKHVRPIVVASVIDGFRNRLKTIVDDVDTELRNINIRRAIERARECNDHRDDNKEIFDNLYYHVEGYGTGNTYIFVVDYMNMDEYSPMNASASGFVYQDPYKPKRSLVRMASGNLRVNMSDNGVKSIPVKLYRDASNIYINGVKYRISTLPVGERNTLSVDDANVAVGADAYFDKIEALTAEIRSTIDAMKNGNMMLSADDLKEITSQANDINKTIALTRQEIEKLY